jgi:nitric oxide dioxygenase
MLSGERNNNNNTLIFTTAIAAIAATGLYFYSNNNKKEEEEEENNSNSNSNSNSSTTTMSSKCPFSAGGKYCPASMHKEGLITNLENARSSEGMGLPAALSQATIDMIVATTPVVGPKVLDITKCFYGKVLPRHPGLLQFFNPAHNVPNSDHQPKALAASVVAYATNITDLSPLLVPGGPVAAICHRHCALAIFPAQYVVVHDNLMEAIGEILAGVVTPEIAAAWSEAVLFLAKAMIDTEESLYKMAEQRSGGWSGFAEFEVSDITSITDDVKQISYKPVDGSPLSGSTFEFTPGQYLSLQIDMDGNGHSAPRHYTCTSPVNGDYLQCCVKKIKGGKLSTYVHERLKVGDKVALSAPFGVFTAPDEPTSTSVVLISAGIGVTPMVNLNRHCKDNVALVVHVDATPETHPRKNDFDGCKKTLFKYTKVDGGKRPVTKDFVSEIIEQAGGTDHEFFICGPETFMDDIQKELLTQGAKKVVCEVFGSQLATGCPFFAGN